MNICFHVQEYCIILIEQARERAAVMIKQALNIAIPKGRLLNNVFLRFKKSGIHVPEHRRRLIIPLPAHQINILLVKNTDLTAYVANGIASLGIVGSDVLNESSSFFYSHGKFDFGETRICLIASKDTAKIEDRMHTTIATKYIRFTHDFVSRRGLNATIIPLRGSVELAPLLGLAPYIVDLVDTGQTIKENGLVIQEELGKTTVQLISNPSQYKYYHKAIEKFLRILEL